MNFRLKTSHRLGYSGRVGKLLARSILGQSVVCWGGGGGGGGVGGGGANTNMRNHV